MKTIKTLSLILFYILLLIASYLTIYNDPEGFVILHKWYGIITIFFAFFYSFYKLSSFLVIDSQRRELKKLLKEIEKDIVDGRGMSMEHDSILKQFETNYSSERSREFLRDQEIRNRYN